MHDDELKRLLEGLLSDKLIEVTPSEIQPEPGAEPRDAQDLGKLAARFQAAARLAHAASSILDLDELLPRVVDLIRDEFDYDYVGVFITDERQEWAVLQAATGTAGRQMMDQGYRLGLGDDSMIGWCLANRKARMALDIEEDDVHPAGPLVPGMRSAMALPLVSRGRLVGAMTVQSTRPAAFSERDVTILQTMADQLANAIENARLYTEAMHRTAELSSVLKASAAISSSLDLKEILVAIAEQMAKAVGVDGCTLSYWDREADAVVTWAEVRLDGQEPDEPGTAYALADFPLTRRVLEERQAHTVSLGDPKADPAEVELLQEHGFMSLLMLPLVAGRRTIGLIELEASTRERHFTGRELDLVTVLASQAAVALENARLFEEAQQSSSLLARRVNEITCLNEIGLKIDETPPVPDFLEWVAERIPPAMRHPDLCVVAIEFQGRTYGTSDAMRLPCQMVQRLRIGDEPVGKICVAYTERRDFLDDESAMLGDIARRVSGYIEKQNALTEAEALYQATTELTAALSFEEIVTVLRSHTLLGRADRSVSLSLFDRPWVGDDMPERIIPAARWTQVSDPDGARLGLHELPSASRLLRPDRPTIIADIQTDPRMDGKARARYLERWGAQSTIAVPLLVGGQWLGFVEGLFSEATEFSESGVRRLAALAGQAAVVIQNLRQLAETRARARREQILREITARVRGFTDPDTLAQAAVRELGTALGRPVFLRLGSAEELSQGTIAQEVGDGDEERHEPLVSIQNRSGRQADLTRSRKSEGGE
jgi:GAF domain-containing protein